MWRSQSALVVNASVMLLNLGVSAETKSSYKVNNRT